MNRPNGPSIYYSIALFGVNDYCTDIIVDHTGIGMAVRRWYVSAELQKYF